jgi:hypothetical protein
MGIRASTPGEGVAPIQIRAQVLRRRPGFAYAGAGMAFPLVPDDPAAEATGTAAQGTGQWKQADVKRAINAAEKAGLTSYRVEIAADGTISIIVGDPADTAPPD